MAELVALILEDDEAFRESVELLVQREGFKTVSAGTIAARSSASSAGNENDRTSPSSGVTRTSRLRATSDNLGAATAVESGNTGGRQPAARASVASEQAAWSTVHHGSATSRARSWPHRP